MYITACGELLGGGGAVTFEVESWQVLDRQPGGPGTRCCNCDRTEAEAKCPVRTRVIDWRTEWMCSRCVTTFDWAGSDYDGVATYTRRDRAVESYRCPCCGGDVMDEPLACSACREAGCEQTRDGTGEPGWWKWQRQEVSER